MRQNGFTLTELITAIMGIGAFGLVLLALYAAAHFVLKFW